VVHLHNIQLMVVVVGVAYMMVVHIPLVVAVEGTDTDVVVVVDNMVVDRSSYNDERR
jgi:hypothetical protein